MRNPPVADDAFLRTSLLPGLLRALRTNRSRQVRAAALFEVGHVFRLASGPTDVPVEEHDAIAWSMFGVPDPGVHGGGRQVDFFDAKGAVEELMEALGIERWALEGSGPAPYHPARSARVLVGGDPAGVVGELEPTVAERFDLPGRVGVAELDATALTAHATTIPGYRDIPRYPPVRRDLAFTVPEPVPAGDVESAIRDAGGDLVWSVVLFDVFRGPPVREGRKSLAFSVDFRAPGRTLHDQEADAAVQAIVDRVSARLGGELRAG